MNKILIQMETLFLGQSPSWYKRVIVAILVINPVLYYCTNPTIVGWLVIAEFIFILASALTCYPLFPGGILAIEVVILKMAPMDKIMHELHGNLDVIMLLMFMVPGIFFLKPLLLRIFIWILSNVKSKTTLSVCVLVMSAFLSAWLDALTVVAVLITVCVALHEIYSQIKQDSPEEAEEFHGFLRNLLMHGAVGTALGGVSTIVGEPQNLMIGHYAKWGFGEFYLRMAHFSIPLQIGGIVTCFALEHFKIRALGFGYQLSPTVATAMGEYSQKIVKGPYHKAEMIIMAVMMVVLMLSLAFQLAPIGMIGLGLLITVPLLTGYVNEHNIGKAFEESMPFTSLLVVFFVIVTMIEHLGLFNVITHFVLNFTGSGQYYAMFIATGILSSISDNVFVASIYIHQVQDALVSGLIDQVKFEKLLIIVNAGTNIFSIATPNGQAAFLFLLTSAIARKVNLSYSRMLLLALPYTIVLIGLSLALVLL